MTKHDFRVHKDLMLLSNKALNPGPIKFLIFKFYLKMLAISNLLPGETGFWITSRGIFAFLNSYNFNCAYMFLLLSIIVLKPWVACHI